MPKPLCRACVKRPIFVKRYRLCCSCYNREWRKSQGPDSPYIRRARTPKRLRKVA